MDYEIKWLAEARESLNAEMEFVFVEFGRTTLEKSYHTLMERVSQLQMFPRLGVRCEDLDYHGYEIRMLHVRKISIVYTIVENIVQILYVWNNQRDPGLMAKIVGLQQNRWPS